MKTFTQVIYPLFYLFKFFRQDNDYALQCFHYIHNNPVKDELVIKATGWNN